jgi:hypothetical protein
MRPKIRCDRESCKIFEILKELNTTLIWSCWTNAEKKKLQYKRQPDTIRSFSPTQKQTAQTVIIDQTVTAEFQVPSRADKLSRVNY